MNKLYYWIPTDGKKVVLFKTTNSKEEPPQPFKNMYSYKRCNWFVYTLFKKFRINWLAKDKLAWLKH